MTTLSFRPSASSFFIEYFSYDDEQCCDIKVFAKGRANKKTTELILKSKKRINQHKIIKVLKKRYKKL